MSQTKEQDKTIKKKKKTTTKWNGDRHSNWERIQSNESKDDPTSQKIIEAQTKKIQEIFKKS